MSSNTNNVLQGDIVQQLKNLLASRKAKKNVYGREGIRPLNDWHIITGTALILVALGSIIGFYVYHLVEAGQFSAVQNVPEQKALKINSDLLRKQIDELTDRAGRWDFLNQEIEQVADPASL